MKMLCHFVNMKSYCNQEIEEISNFEDQEVTPRITGSRKCNIMYICLVNSLYFEHFRFKNHIHRNNFLRHATLGYLRRVSSQPSNKNQRLQVPSARFKRVEYIKSESA